MSNDKRVTQPFILEAIWAAIGRQGRQNDQRVNSFIKRGCALGHQIEDYLCDVGVLWTDYHQVVEAMDVSEVTLFSRPRSGKNEAYGSEGLQLIDMAFLMIQLQRYGIATDPQPLIDALRPTLAKQAHLTHEELRIYWHKQEQGKLFSTLVADGAIDEPGQFTTSTGYKCILDNNLDGNGVLFVAGPRTYKKDFLLKMRASGAGWHDPELWAA